MSEQRSRRPDAYRSLVEQAPYGIFRTSRSGEILLANPALVDLLGYDSEEEVLELDLDRDVYVDPARREEIIDAHRSGRYSDVDARWKRADGNEIVVRMSGHAARDEDGDLLYFETFVEDVTEQRRTEERLNRVLETVGAFVYTLVPDGDTLRFEWLSGGVESLLGYRRREALQPGWFPLGLHPDDRDRILGTDGEDFVDGKVVHEFRFRHRDGGYRWFREELRVLEGGAGGSEEPARIVGVSVDITDRKKAELALTQAGERLRSIMNAVPDAIINIDAEGRIDDLNPAAEEIYGYPVGELIGRPFTILFPERFRAVNSRRFQKLLRDGDGAGFRSLRMRGLHASGEEFSAEISVAQHTMDGAQYVTAVFRDMTGQRLLEAEREALIAELRTALEEVRTLRGILPICARCKKIRDEAGHWERVESYLKTHSEAELSHGICPDCAQELYGDDLLE